ncbi:unnamed protein product [Miscanthus lutarioriparius]|uniref:Glycosyl transferase family 28 C-terminal domain-containing protein n=1 Tax=Miscanthus lutarioriparius TaxID=422564 RepID=A0A811NDB0_9POAL|nr:unnamed protein product [Miscanthus lutarioriparius]
MPAPTAEPALPAAFLLRVPSPLLSTPLPGAALSASPAPSSSSHHHASFLPRPRGGPRALSVAISVPGPTSSAAASRLHQMWGEFARFVRLHGNQIAPLGFASLGLGLGGGGGGGGNAGGGGGGGGDVDGVGEVEEEAAARAEAPKKVLILMSDTGGGHRASAEAIKAAFTQEFGDDYQLALSLSASLKLPLLYAERLQKDELRRELGMDEDLPAVLLMGGGEGMGPIEATAKALGDSLYDENLGEPTGQILSINWKVPVQVKGFVTKMEECMGACDCIITKAGPGTIAEAMIRGLPIILNGYIAGQETQSVKATQIEDCCTVIDLYTIYHELKLSSKSWLGARFDCKPDAMLLLTTPIEPDEDDWCCQRCPYAASMYFDTLTLPTLAIFLLCLPVFLMTNQNATIWKINRRLPEAQAVLEGALWMVQGFLPLPPIFYLFLPHPLP